MPPIMLPTRLPKEVLTDPKRAAEIEVFDRLKTDDSLNENWHVFYSFDWIAEYGGMTRDGEADFVIAHPDVGFLVIEVKGGRVTVRPGPKWTSVGSGGVVHEIQNGMQQAMKSKKVLLRALVESWGARAPFIRARHGVVLPHSPEPDLRVGDLATGMPRDLFVFKGEMQRLGLRVRELINWNSQGADDKIGLGGARGISLLRGLYGREIELRPSLRDEISDVENLIVELSAAQAKVLGLLRKHNCCAIQGAAGTGKTVIAKAKALKEIRSGRSVLLLCFNRLLEETLERELRAQLSSEESARLAVHTFHGLCHRVTRREKKFDEMEEEYFADILPTCFHEAVMERDITGSGLPLQLDTMIIDEGQDFSADWLRSLRDLAELNEASIAVFYDGNQCIYRDNEVSSIFGVTEFTLSENFRNSKEIYEVVSSYVDDENFESMGPPGPSVRFIESDGAAVSSVIGREIEVLIETEGVPAGDIVVLTGSAVGVDAVPNLGVETYSIWQYKGLDSPVVVLAHLKNALSRPELAYVGVSRARSLLIVVDSAENINRLRIEIPIALRKRALSERS
jgi:hypothetical protein